MNRLSSSQSSKIYALPFGQQSGRNDLQKQSYCWTDFYSMQTSTISNKGGYIGNSFRSKPKYNAIKKPESKQPDIYTYYKGIQLAPTKKYSSTIMARERSDAYKVKKDTQDVEFIDVTKSKSFIEPRPHSSKLYTSDRNSFRGGKMASSAYGQ